MESTSIKVNGNEVRLIGVCQGLEGEAQAAVKAIETHPPTVLALALGPELADNVEQITASEDPDAGGPELQGLGAEDGAYAQGLSRWGTVRLPAPTFPAVVDAADRLDARIEGVDLAEADFLDRHLDRIGILELMKKALKVRWLGWRPPKADSPGAFCRAFDQRVNKGPLERLQRDRERSMAGNLEAIAHEGAVTCVLAVERLDGVKRALEARGPDPNRVRDRADPDH